jgi:hypothetical protein
LQKKLGSALILFLEVAATEGNGNLTIDPFSYERPTQNNKKRIPHNTAEWS